MVNIRVLLFAMTGFGNNALKVLSETSFVNLIGVFIPGRLETPFPYYECKKIEGEAESRGIHLYEDFHLREESAYKTIKNLSPDLIVVGGFNQILPENIISIPKLGAANIHPSLLPKYRGATPTAWALINGEKETGVTVHFIENEKLDQGRIVSQARTKINPSDTDGSLRFRLAMLSEDALREAVDAIISKDKGDFAVQDEAEATYYPKRTLKDAEIILDRPVKEIVGRIRAMTPYPGAYLQYGNKIYMIKDATLVKEKVSGGGGSDGGKKLIVNTLEGMVEFQIAEEE